VHRAESTVRAATAQTGEADFAFEIGYQNITEVPVAKMAARLKFL
jgi:hypothetical protein